MFMTCHFAANFTILKIICFSILSCCRWLLRSRRLGFESPDPVVLVQKFHVRQKVATHS